MNICYRTGFLESFVSELMQEQENDRSEYRRRVDLVRFPFVEKGSYVFL
jgi:hypothetical protein